jgi:hypothetical protein
VGNTAAESNRGSEQATRAVAGAQAAQTQQQSFKTFFITVEVLGFGD